MDLTKLAPLVDSRDPHPGRGPGTATLVAAAAALVVGVAAAAWILAQPRGGPQLGTSAAIASTPEARLEKILYSLRRAMGTEDPSASSLPGGNDGASARWSTTLRHELIEPDAEHPFHRAVIHVETRSAVTIMNRPADDREDQRNGGREGGRRGDAAGGDEPEDPRDAFIAEAATRRPEPRPAERHTDPITTIEDVAKSDFRLEDRDQRWTLLDQPDPETQSALGKAFEYALKRQ